jgi:hypothetical protein
MRVYDGLPTYVAEPVHIFSYRLVIPLYLGLPIVAVSAVINGLRYGMLYNIF